MSEQDYAILYTVLSSKPIWVLITMALLFALREPLKTLIADRLPHMVSSHFKRRAIQRSRAEGSEQDTARLKLEQHLETEKLRFEQQLKESEDFRKQSREREQTYIEIIKGMVNFIETLATSELQNTRLSLTREIGIGHADVSKQIGELAMAIQRLEKTVRGENRIEQR